MSRTIAIGDIHGCSKALSALIDQLSLSQSDTVVTLGDYVDRGQDSQGVIDQLLALENRCQLVPLLGNHELMMLAAFDSEESLRFWLQCGGSATLESYGGSLENVPESHVGFLRDCQPHYETEQHIFLHANYDPQLALSEQPERLLFWEHLMFYDNGFHTIPARHSSGKVAIVGHTPQESGEILDLGDVICIDTYCFGGGRLTALDVDSGKLCQVDQEGHLVRGLS